MLINKCKSVGTKHCSYFKAFIEYSNDMHITYEDIDECNPNKKREILIVFDGMIFDILNNGKLNLILKLLEVEN